MSVCTANIRYARALFDIAMEAGKEDIIYDDMHYLIDVFMHNRPFYAIMHNPTLSSLKKQKLIRAVFGTSFEPISVRFLDLLIRNNKETNIIEIARAFVQLHRNKKNIRRAVLRSMVEMPDEIMESLRKKLEDFYQCPIEVGNKIDQNLIGGFTLKIDETFIDMSLSGRINSLKKELIETSYIKNL